MVKKREIGTVTLALVVCLLVDVSLAGQNAGALRGPKAHKPQTSREESPVPDFEVVDAEKLIEKEKVDERYQAEENIRLLEESVNALQAIDGQDPKVVAALKEQIAEAKRLLESVVADEESAPLIEIDAEEKMAKERKELEEEKARRKEELKLLENTAATMESMDGSDPAMLGEIRKLIAEARQSLDAIDSEDASLSEDNEDEPLFEIHEADVSDAEIEEARMQANEHEKDRKEVMDLLVLRSGDEALPESEREVAAGLLQKLRDTNFSPEVMLEALSIMEEQMSKDGTSEKEQLAEETEKRIADPVQIRSASVDDEVARAEREMKDLEAALADLQKS